MPNTTGGITLFTPENPIIIRKVDLYDPTVSPPTGNIIPVVDTLVVDDSNNYTLYAVASVDPVTHASTLRPVRLAVFNTDPANSLTSVVSYGNDIFRLYYDDRATPTEVHPDSRLVVFGTDNVSYQLVLNPGSSQTVISRHYDASGAYTGQMVPMAAAADIPGQMGPGVSYLTSCHVQAPLTDGQEIFIEVFNSQGAQTALISAFAKPSIIMNEAITPSPVITDVAITSTQMRSNGEIFIYERQSVSSLGLQVVLTYSDGTTSTVPIDQAKCFLYGTEDFIPSYPGLRQTLVAKYFLDLNETMSSGLATQHRNFVTVEADLVVISNGLQAGVKITTIPRWNATTNKYDLSFFLYTTTRNTMTDVTNLVTISPSTPYQGAYFGQKQVLTLQLDMALAQPTIYSASTIYQQTCVITLMPLAATDHYVLQDATNAPLVYGQTSLGSTRPVLHYDSAIQQYYVPAAFPSEALFLQNFFTNANPPYDTANETEAPTPTHFWLRDPSSGLLLNSAPMPVGQYNAAMSIIGAGLPNRYAGTGSNLIVEFLVVLSDQTKLLLWGSPVDVYTGTYNG